MTCRYSDINQHDALYNVCRGYPGGLEAMARRMSLLPDTWRKKTRPGVESHHASFEEVSCAIELAEEARMPDAFSPLHAFCWRHNHVAVKLPEAPPDPDDLLKQLVDVMGEQGTLANDIRTALATDNDINISEVEKIEKDIMESISALVVLRLKVRQKHEEDRRGLR